LFLQRSSQCTPQELNDSIIATSEESITENGLANSSAKVFPRGTLVVALYGATVGRTGILDMEAASNQAVCAVFPKVDRVVMKYLYWFLRFKRPDLITESFGGAHPNISQKVLRETVIPLPPNSIAKRHLPVLRYR
jgi:type I restriction enzyme S subunit